MFVLEVSHPTPQWVVFALADLVNTEKTDD